jgi:curli biogenesis system outer membrane secretion channel CsgG/predicted small lipoprotein YifL
MRNSSLRTLGVALLVAALAACGKKSDAPTPAAALTAVPAAPTAPAVPTASAVATPPVPDVGKLETVKVSADGYGSSASEAVAEAMQLAILQVNGASVDMTTVKARFGLDVTMNQTWASMRAEAFADAVRTRSGGVIQNFRIVNMDEPVLPKGKYKASIEAGIARFDAPAELKKIRLVVAPLRFDRASVPIGGRMVPADEVGAELRQRIQDALVNTGRFAVLDRDFSPEIQQELDMIATGAAPSAEMAKLSQAVSADIVWSGRINNLAYNRHARQLRSSDRQLVSYSGGWSVSQKLVNVATRQIVTGETLTGVAPSTAPTTLGTGVNAGKVLGNMADELVNSVVASILTRTFPITVIALQGPNVVLSQGGQALRTGARYALVMMGTEMKDPQTGQSLGRVETPCCQLVIDRVTPNLSYGHIEGATVPLDTLLPGALQVREQIKVNATGAAVAANNAKATPPAVGEASPRSAPRAPKEAGAPPSTADKKNDDKW